MKLSVAIRILLCICTLPVDSFSFRRVFHKIGKVVENIPAQVEKHSNKIGDAVEDTVNKAGQEIPKVIAHAGKEIEDAGQEIAKVAVHSGKEIEKAGKVAVKEIKAMAMAVRGDCVGSHCCLNINLGKLKDNFKVCLHVTFDQEQQDFGVRMKVDGKTIIHAKQNIHAIGASLCKAVRRLPVSLCVGIYDIDISEHVISGTVMLKVEAVMVTLLDISLGRFHIPLKKGSQVKFDAGKGEITSIGTSVQHTCINVFVPVTLTYMHMYT